MTKPFVYIASPYTKGDPALNTRFQMQAFHELLESGIVIPYAPLVSHFQHLLYPQSYETWMAYDFAMIERMDALLALDAELVVEGRVYSQRESSGRDREIEHAKAQDIPIFTSILELFRWAKTAKPRLLVL